MDRDTDRGGNRDGNGCKRTTFRIDGDGNGYLVTCSQRNADAKPYISIRCYPKRDRHDPGAANRLHAHSRPLRIAGNGDQCPPAG